MNAPKTVYRLTAFICSVSVEEDVRYPFDSTECACFLCSRNGVSVTTCRIRYLVNANSVFHELFTDAPSADVLTIKKVDLCIEENGKLHHTKRYELMTRDGQVGPPPRLVVRRGQAFRLRLICDRPFDRSRDAMSLIFTVDGEERPTHGHGSLVGVALQQYRHMIEDPLEWGAAIDFISGDALEILVKPAATAAVTKWRLDFDTKLLSEGFGKSYSLQQSFYLLFNPWCKDDQVYLEGMINQFSEIFIEF